MTALKIPVISHLNDLRYAEHVSPLRMIRSRSRSIALGGGTVCPNGVHLTKEKKNVPAFRQKSVEADATFCLSL